MNYPTPTLTIQRLLTRSQEYAARSRPVRDMPINIRPAVVFVTAAWILLLGVLGMAPLDIPLNDKALHFFGMGFATFLVYFIIDVPESPSKRLWYIRRSPLILTLITTFLIGGVLSEFVQSLLPWKTFQLGDIIANLLGSSLFLYLAHMLYQRNRQRLEITSLYQPLSAASYRDAQGREHTFAEGEPPQRSTIWDEDSD